MKTPVPVWRQLRQPRVALMLALGFASGLPILLAFSTLSIRLRQAGVAHGHIGLFSYLMLSYALKFAWAPFIEAFDVPVLSRLLGRSRAWMLLSQIVIAAGLVGIAFNDPATNLIGVAAFAAVVAFGSATQDVVIDGWRIDAAPQSKQGLMAASAQFGYRLALLCGGAGALFIAGWEFGGWRAAYLAMAALMSVGMVAALLAPPVGRDMKSRNEARVPRFSVQAVAAAVWEPLAELYRRKGATLVPILVLVSLYRLPDFVAGVMAGPLYVDVGFSNAEIASVSKLYGVWVGIVGILAGGYFITRFGLFAALLVGAIAGAASNLMFCWLAWEGKDLLLLTLAISVDNFSGSFAGTALIAYMSGLTGAGFATTQYALLSSLYALPGKFIGGFSGYMVEDFGYSTFFALTASIGIPAAILCLLVARLSPEALGDRDVVQGEPGPRSVPA
jgi:PAT family beta-lactamase induction signal transducer AmpG